MFTNERYIRIQNNPKFHNLVKRRSKFAWQLSAIMIAAYYTFILIIAFFPAFLGRPLLDGMVTSIGIPLGMFIIVLAFILTGLYVRRANHEFDELTKKIIEESLNE